MSPHWKLRLVDHDHVVIRGIPLLHQAAESALRAHLLSKPWETNRELLAAQESRAKVLKDLGAPAVLQDHAARAIQESRGGHCAEEQVKRMDLPDLRRLLLSWNLSQRTYDLGTMFDLLHWAGDPQRRARAGEAVLSVGNQSIVEPHWRLYPKHSPTTWDHALYGSEDLPADSEGNRLEAGDAFGSYNAPPRVRSIWEDLSRTRLPDWPALLEEFRRNQALISGRLAEEDLESDLQRGWMNLTTAYRTAAQRGFGVCIAADG